MPSWVIGAVAAVVVLLVLLLILRRRGGQVDHALPGEFKRVGRLMTTKERKFHELLAEATGEHFRVYPKVALGSLIQPVVEDGEEAPSMAVLGHEVDFVLCSADDRAVLAVIQLEMEDTPLVDQDEETSTSLQMNPVDEAMAIADLSVARFDPTKSHTPGDIQKHLANSLSLPMKVFGAAATHRLEDQPVDEEPAGPKKGTDGNPLCPSCDATMVQRTAKQGKHAGRTFWVCSKFPECKKVLPVK